MGDVINILKNKPHISGDAVCLHCKHEWVGVWPLGVVGMECPACGLMKGVNQGLTVPEEVWQCKCGGLHFFVSGKGNILCCHCGLIQEFPW